MSRAPVEVRFPLWLTGGLACVLLGAMASSFQTYRTATAAAREAPDPYFINLQPERLRQALPLLPPDGKIGYLSDMPFDGVQGSAAFFGAMYAVAPRLLTRSADEQPFVLGSFSRPQDFAAAGAAHHLQVVRDFGNGIVLFRRAP